jgi:hypothetical protein
MPSTLDVQIATIAANVWEAYRLSASSGEAVLQDALASLPIPAVVANGHDRCETANRAAAAVTGYSAAQLFDLSIGEILPRFHDHDARDEGPQRGHYLFVRPDGQLQRMEYAVCPNILPGLHLFLFRVRRRAVMSLPSPDARVQAKVPPDTPRCPACKLGPGHATSVTTKPVNSAKVDVRYLCARCGHEWRQARYWPALGFRAKAT